MLSLIFDFLGKTSYWISFGIYISRYIVNICNICILRALFSWICFCKPITLHLENWISPSHWQEIIWSSGKISSAQEFASVSLHQEVWIFPSHWQSSINWRSSIGLHLFKNLLLSTYHSPPRKSDFPP